MRPLGMLPAVGENASVTADQDIPLDQPIAFASRQLGCEEDG
jgi:hypothetical protein